MRIVPRTHAADWAEFTAQLPEDGCRYAVLSFSVMTKTGVIDPHKLVFFSWFRMVFVVGAFDNVKERTLRPSSMFHVH